MHRFAIFAVASALATANAAYASPPTSGPAVAAPRDQIVCRRFVRTGSLVDGYRTCKTRAEWDREQENVRQFSMSDACRLRGDPSQGPHTPDC